MATYKDAINWIVENDDSTYLNEILEDENADVSPLVTVVMVSHIWNKDIEIVVKDLVKEAKRLKKNEGTR